MPPDNGSNDVVGIASLVVIALLAVAGFLIALAYPVGFVAHVVWKALTTGWGWF